MLFMRAIRKVEGITASAIPLYLPPGKAVDDAGFDDKVFFGAISMYLREKVSIFKNMPDSLDRFFSLPPFLKLAANQAGTTRTEGLENLTLNMIEGDNAFKQNEVKRLVRYLESTGKPDVIHLSNALILGLARQLKKHINVKIVCSLLNEDDWIEEMAEPFKSKAWELIAREAENVDRFTTPSRYYKDFFISKTGLSGESIDIIPLGVDSEFIETPKITHLHPAIGYFCRMNSFNGFDKITDAFIELKKRNVVPNLKLHLCGGYTSDDKPFVSKHLRKIKENGFLKDVKVFHEFQGNKKADFINSVDVISVPVRKYDGYGLYILEANLAGIPVVQPATGAFPEIVSATGGGLTYTPDTIEALVEALTKVMTDKELRSSFSKSGYEKARSEFSLEKMSQELDVLYKKAIHTNLITDA
jgi:glycosyltransferase involved in cell wall biosynthesis